MGQMENHAAASDGDVPRSDAPPATVDETAPEDVDDEMWQFVCRYCDSLRIQGSSVHTIRNYLVDLRDYFRWAHRAKIDPLHPSHRQLRRYLGELDRARYARSSINRRLSSLRSFFRWMVVAGYTASNPADVLHGLKDDKSLPHRISPQDMVRILRVWGPQDQQGAFRQQDPIDLRNQALLEFLYACGARISEASNLLVSQVDVSQRQVRVVGKGSKERIIPIHVIALESMTRYFEFARRQLLIGHPENEHFFVSTRGNQMGTDAMRKMFKDTLRKAGVNGSYTPHDMRHTFASDLLDGGADLRSVQEMLGHASLSTTQIYTHVSVKRLREVHHQAHPRG